MPTALNDVPPRSIRCRQLKVWASFEARRRTTEGISRTAFVRWPAVRGDADAPGVVLFELWYGGAESQRPKANAERMATFLSGPPEVLDFTPEDAEHAGRVRAALEGLGKPIGAYDLLIAGQALRHKATLVTANSSEFARVRGLRLQDWTTLAR
jgi:tRNA(fMet)-specific endonuclease VapC